MPSSPRRLSGIRPILRWCEVPIALADVWTARHFGLELDDAVWAGLAQHVLRGGGFEVPQYAGIIEEARQIAEERRFFHWELEFPEVFFDKHGRLLAEEAGFDAVVGNPPYVTTGTLRSADRSAWQHYKSQYVSASSGKFDIYLPFLEFTTGHFLQQGSETRFLTSRVRRNVGFRAGSSR